MEKHLYFVRHGESNSNADGVLRGRDSVLSEKGHREARTVAERIEKIGVDAIVSSSYIRAVETATPIAERLGLSIETSDLFIERRSPSSFKDRSKADIAFKEEVDVFQKSFPLEGYRHSDEETFPEFKARTLEAMRFLDAHPAQRICVVTHGIFLRMLFCGVLFGDQFIGEDFRNTWRIETSNTGISHLRLTGNDENRWRIMSWNDMAHFG